MLSQLETSDRKTVTSFIILHDMKVSVLFFLLLVCFSETLKAGDSTLVFRRGSFSSMEEASQGSGKPIMLCILPEDCVGGNCFKEVKQKILPDKAVGYFYNRHFLNFTVDPYSEEGQQICTKFGIKSGYPVFLYFDSLGNLTHKIVGVKDEISFIEEGKKAITPNMSLSSYKERYRTGVRTPVFLRNFCRLLYNASELDSVIINEYLGTQSTSLLDDSVNVKFIYEFCVVHYVGMLPLDSPAFKFLYEKRQMFYKQYSRQDVDLRIVWNLLGEMYNAAEAKDENKFNAAIRLIKPFDNGQSYEWKNSAGGVTAWPESNHLVSFNSYKFYQKFGDSKKYLKAMSEYAKDIWSNSSALNALAWEVFEGETDTIFLVQALKYSKRAVSLKPDANYLDTYANVLWKLGHLNEALKQAKLAFDKARLSNRDLAPFQSTVDKIQKQIGLKN